MGDGDLAIAILSIAFTTDMEIACTLVQNGREGSAMMTVRGAPLRTGVDGSPSDLYDNMFIIGRVARAAAPGSAGRGSGVAICATRCGGFRSLQYAATIAVWINLHISQCLRPKSRLIIAGQKRPNRSNRLWRLEIRQERKKMWRIGSLLTAFRLRFPRKRPGIGDPNPCKTGHKTNQNRHSNAVVSLAFGPEQPASPHPQPVQPVLAHGLHGLDAVLGAAAEVDAGWPRRSSAPAPARRRGGSRSGPPAPGTACRRRSRRELRSKGIVSSTWRR